MLNFAMYVVFFVVLLIWLALVHLLGLDRTDAFMFGGIILGCLHLYFWPRLAKMMGLKGAGPVMEFEINAEAGVLKYGGVTVQFDMNQPVVHLSGKGMQVFAVGKEVSGAPDLSNGGKFLKWKEATVPLLIGAENLEGMISVVDDYTIHVYDKMAHGTVHTTITGPGMAPVTRTEYRELPTGEMDGYTKDTGLKRLKFQYGDRHGSLYYFIELPPMMSSDAQAAMYFCRQQFDMMSAREWAKRTNKSH